MTAISKGKSGQELKQGRSLEAGPDGRGREGVLLTGLLLRVYSDCFLLSTQNHQPAGGTTHNKLGSPTLVTNQENVPQDSPWANLRGDIFLTEVPFSQMMLAWSSWNKTSQHARPDQNYQSICFKFLLERINE